MLSQISEGIFQGWERMDLVGYVSVPICVLRVIFILVLLEMGLDIQGIVICLTVLQFATMLLQWLVLARCMGMPPMAFGLDTARDMIRSSSPFLGIQGMVAIEMSVGVTILSKIGGETAVGVYAAASQLLGPVSLLLKSVAFALFPAMCRGFDWKFGPIVSLWYAG